MAPKVFFICILLIVVRFNCISQNGVHDDSLAYYLKKSVTPEQKAKTYLELASNKFLMSDAQKFWKCIRAAEELTHNPEIVSEIYIIKGHYFIRISSQSDSGLYYFRKAYDIKNELHDQRGIAASLNGIGISYWLLGESKKGLNYMLKSAAISEVLSDSAKLADSYNNIAALLVNINEIDESINYFEKALAIRRIIKNGENDKIAGTLNNLAFMYASQKKDFNKAFSNINESIEINQRINNKSGLALNYAALANFYTETRKYEEAISYSKLSLDINKSIGNTRQQIGNLMCIANACDKLKRHKEALEFYNKALVQVRGLSNPDVESDVIYSMYEFYLNRSDFQNALKYYKTYVEKKDSVCNNETIQKTKQLLSKYQAEKAAYLLEAIKKEKDARFYKLALITYIIIGMCVVIVFFVVIFFTKRSSRQKKELEKSQQKNLLETIVKTQEEERRKLAEDLHDGLGQLLIGVKMTINNSGNALSVSNYNEAALFLKNGIEITEDAIAEAKTISRRLLPPPLKELGLVRGITQMVDRNNLCSKYKIILYTHSIPKTLSQFFEINIYRICQELISNTNKHSKATEATLQLFYRQNAIIIQMDDNGIGFDYNPENLKGMGIQNIKGRVKMMNGEFQIDTGADKGTVIIIEIPISS